jgi:hypothetical protein
MRVFLSHSRTDEPRASSLRRSLTAAGLEIADPVISAPTGKGLAPSVDDLLLGSDAIVFIITSNWAKTRRLRHDLEFVLRLEQFDNRVFAWELGGVDKTPWMLRRLWTARGTADEAAQAIAAKLAEQQP